MQPEPDFVAGRELPGRAWRLAAETYAGPEVAAGAGTDHPIAVAELIDTAGFTDEVVAAALLHDLVEDTPATTDEVTAGFGAEIGGWVGALTEDTAIEDYHERKWEHRRRVLAAGSVPASIYLADKLARTRAMRAAGERTDPDRLEHYWDTLELYTSRRPELPFLFELAEELPKLEPAEPGDQPDD
ncbi:MAG TPA: HD domain-containing protein [Solirubrobacterales bacterium]|nr:HD domain-containing protein [Solirubrobacterales bacterium]